MKIVYVAPLRENSTASHRMNAIINLNHEVIPINTKSENVLKKQSNLGYRILNRIAGQLDPDNINKKVLESLKESDCDILWIDKGLIIKDGTLERVKSMYPGIMIIGYSPDDMFNPENHSKYFFRGLIYYDLFITNKPGNVEKIKTSGCNDVLLVKNGYDPDIHKPTETTTEEKALLGGAVGFIGAYEKERAEYLKFLTLKKTDVHIWGEGWPLKTISNLKVENKYLYNENYSKAICSFDINLGFLRKASGDVSTTRSVEIPACGGFMLAERTQEHLELFKEGEEAEYFTSKNEMLDKTLYYLKNPEKRKQIALKGRERCLKSGYSNKEILANVFKHIESRHKVN